MSKPTVPPPPSGPCDWCHELSEQLKFCGRCRIGRYCSSECSAAHWPKHRNVCKPPPDPKSNTAPVVELESLCKVIAFYLAQQAKGEALPLHLYSPITRKVRVSEQEIQVHLGYRTEEAVKPSQYDLSASSPQESVLSWGRMFAINWGNKIARAVALAINSSLLANAMRLQIAGRPVIAVNIYTCEPKLPLWTLVPCKQEEDEPEPDPEPQEREHGFVGLRVAPLQLGEPEEVFFIDFHAIALGLSNTITIEGLELYFLGGWSQDLRRDYPLVYRTAQINRDQAYMNKWSQLWPELKQAPVHATAPNLELERALFASRVERVEGAIESLLVMTKSS